MCVAEAGDAVAHAHGANRFVDVWSSPRCGRNVGGCVSVRVDRDMRGKRQSYLGLQLGGVEGWVWKAGSAGSDDCTALSRSLPYRRSSLIYSREESIAIYIA